jgi:hypothetical protein
VSRDQCGGETPSPATDPSLAAGGGGAGGAFPDTASGTRLVLYQTRDGAVDLRWHIDPADIAHARAAFGGAEAHAVLRLHSLGARGAERLMADAELGSDADAEGGLAHYPRTVADGRLLAEIGLASDDGGWLLVARSNGLPVAAPVGVDFLHGDARRAGTAAAGAGASSAASVGESVAPDAMPPAEALSLQPEFPLVEPELSALARSGATPVAADDAAPAAAGAAVPATGSAPSGASLIDTMGQSPGGDRGEPRGVTGADAPRATRAAAVGADKSLGPAGRRLGDAGAGPAPEPPPGGVVPRLTQRLHRPAQASDPGPARAAGSGPVCPAAGEATLSAELLVQGSAPPNTLLDLGGHAYRVGPGGRFLLRIPIREREIIMRVLASLPRLPVVARGDAPKDDADVD